MSSEDDVNLLHRRCRYDLIGEGPYTRYGHDAVTRRDHVDFRPHLDHVTRALATRDERWFEAKLIESSRDQHVGKVQCGRANRDTYLCRAAGWARQVLNPKTIFATQGGRHPGLHGVGLDRWGLTSSMASSPNTMRASPS
jgi:hypothetical protein